MKRPQYPGPQRVMTVRELRPEDRDAVREALVESRAFNQDEVRVALEMVESGLQGDYALPAIEEAGWTWERFVHQQVEWA